MTALFVPHGTVPSPPSEPLSSSQWRATRSSCPSSPIVARSSASLISGKEVVDRAGRSLWHKLNVLHGGNTFGGAGIPDFMNGIARCRGVEQVLLDVGSRDPVYLKLIEKRHEYFLGYCEAALRAAGGRIDILALGEDYGSQRGLLISPRTFDRLFRPFMQQYFDLAHKYGARAMMHSCGSVRELIPRFVDMGLDILDVVQVDAAGMSIQELHREFHGKIVLRGTMSVQSTLPNGSVDDVRREVAVRQELYAAGGLIIGPTHAIQPLTPVENVVEMYRAIGSLNAA